MELWVSKFIAGQWVWMTFSDSSNSRDSVILRFPSWTLAWKHSYQSTQKPLHREGKELNYEI